jgi:hypothetical protein
LLLNEKSAAQFGSEGQKRTLAIALKMAQAEFLAGIHGSPPILLIDDVMGELDVKRRSGFLPLLEHARNSSGQVFMTCTEENWPSELGRDLQRRLDDKRKCPGISRAQAGINHGVLQYDDFFAGQFHGGGIDGVSLQNISLRRGTHSQSFGDGHRTSVDFWELCLAHLDRRAFQCSNGLLAIKIISDLGDD